MPSEVLNLGVFQRLRPPLLIIADGEHSADGSRVIPPRPATEVQFPQKLNSFDDIINHVHETALAVPGISQRVDALVEVHIGPLEAVPHTIPHPRSESYIKFAEAMPNNRLLILGQMSFRLNMTKQRNAEPLLLLRLQSTNHFIVHPPLLPISCRIDLNLVPELVVLVDCGEMRLEPV